MRQLVVKILLGAGVVMIAASGCSEAKPGTPTTTSGTMGTDDPSGQPRPPTTSSTTNDYGAPRVANPLDGTPYLTKPCAVLTASQLQALNLPKPGEPDTDSAVAKSSGPGCIWQNSDARSTLGISFLSGNKNGLSDTYRGRDRFKGYFEPTEVTGYPAVFNDSGDYRGQGTCQITVGISDTLTFHTGEQDRLGVKSCDRAKEAAAMVIETIKSGG